MSFDWSDLCNVKNVLEMIAQQANISLAYKEALLRTCFNRLYYAAFKSVEDKVRLNYQTGYLAFQLAWKQRKEHGGSHEQLAGYCASQAPGTPMHETGVILSRMRPLRKKCDYEKRIGNFDLEKTLTLYEGQANDVLAKVRLF